MRQATGYDAFISYSHIEDDVLAAAVQAGLERFARPWYRPRALRVFRDTTNLAASPELWSDIVGALGASDWFVLVASPKAASSRWVQQEVEWWLTNKDRGKFLIALSDGNIQWSGKDFNWQHTISLPRKLSGAFTEEPRWIDLRDIRRTLATANAAAVQAAGPRRLHRRQVRGLVGDWVADIAAPIRMTDKDSLVGEHIGHRRRTRRTVQAVVSILAVLTLAASAAATVAVNQRDLARTQTRIATSREVAALAAANLSTHLNHADLLAVAAYRMDRNPQTQGALFQAAAASPQLERYLPVSAAVSALGTSANGNVIAAGTTTGHIVSFDLTTGSRSDVKALSGTVRQVAVSANGKTIVADNGSEAVAWSVALGHQPKVIGNASSVAVSPSGDLAALLMAPPTGSSAPSALTIRSLISGRERQAQVPAGFLQVNFSDDSAVTLINGGGPWEDLALSDLRTISGSGVPLAPAGGYQAGTSSDGRYSGYVKYGAVIAWQTTAVDNIVSGLNGVAPNAPASALAISRDGKLAAAVESGVIYVGGLKSGVPAAATGTALAANADTSDVTFLGGDDRRLVSAEGNTLALWNLARTSRLSRATGISTTESITAGEPPTLRFSPDGRSLAVTDVGGGGQVYDTGFRLRQAIAPVNGTMLLWNGTQLLLAGALAGANSGKFQIATGNGRIVRQWNDPIESVLGIVGMHVLPDHDRLAVISDDGTVAVYNMRTGAVRRIRTGNPIHTSVFSQDISPDGVGVAFANGSGSGGVVYVNLQTGASHVVGEGDADGILFARNRLFIQRRTGVLEIWDAGGMHLLQVLPGAGGFANALAVSPDGLLVARLSEDGMASISDLATGDVLAAFSLPFPAHTVAADPWGASTMTFTPDGRSLLTASSGGELIRWDTYAPDLVKIDCATAGQSLTSAEWRAYVHTDPPADLSCQGSPSPG
jgi:WD40 repeat protein